MRAQGDELLDARSIIIILRRRWKHRRRRRERKKREQQRLRLRNARVGRDVRIGTKPSPPMHRRQVDGSIRAATAPIFIIEQRDATVS